MCLGLSILQMSILKVVNRSRRMGNLIDAVTTKEGLLSVFVGFIALVFFFGGMIGGTIHLVEIVYKYVKIIAGWF